MAFQTAKTDWTPADAVTDSDFNRIEGNIDDLSRAYVAKGTATEILLDCGEITKNRILNMVATNGNSARNTTVNGIPVYRPGTTQAPNFTAGKMYTLWYNESGNCFFHKASAEGTALAKHVLKSYTFSNDVDTSIPGTLDLDNLASQNVRANVNINGVVGKYSVIDTEGGTVTANQILSGYRGYSRGAEIWGNIPVFGNGAHVDATGSALGASSGNGVNYAYLRPPKGYFDGSSFIRLAQPDFLSRNIREGVNLMGIWGSCGGYKTRMGRFNSGTGNTVTLNLDIVPRQFFCLITDGPDYTGQYDWSSGILLYDETRSITKPGRNDAAYRSFVYYDNHDGEEIVSKGYRDSYVVVNGRSITLTINPSSNSSINRVFQNLNWAYVAIGD